MAIVAVVGEFCPLDIAAAVFVTLLARWAAHLDVVATSAWHFMIGGAVLAAVAGTVEGFRAIDWTPRFMAYSRFLFWWGPPPGSWSGSRRPGGARWAASPRGPSW